MRLSFLELPADERRLDIDQAAIRRNVSPVVLEKDFWVCWLLGILFESELAGSLVFKGGTSLSKVFGVIGRRPARSASSHRPSAWPDCGVTIRRCATCTFPSRPASMTFLRPWPTWRTTSITLAADKTRSVGELIEAQRHSAWAAAY